MIKGRHAKRWILGCAGALLVVALVWRLFLAGDDELAGVARRMRALGCMVYGEDFYIQGNYLDTTIAELLPQVDVAELAKASEAAGFPSDTQKHGEVVVLLAELSSGEVLTIYMLNGEAELCFIQALNSGAVRPVGG